MFEHDEGAVSGEAVGSRGLRQSPGVLLFAGEVEGGGVEREGRRRPFSMESTASNLAANLLPFSHINPKR